MTNVEKLTAIKGLLSKKHRWINTGNLAEDYRRKAVDPIDEKAYMFCLLGAAYLISGANLDQDFFDEEEILKKDRQVLSRIHAAIDWLCGDMGEASDENRIEVFNDRFASHGEVLAVLDKAILLEEEAVDGPV